MLVPSKHISEILARGEEKHYPWQHPQTSTDADIIPIPTDDEMYDADCALRAWLAESYTSAPRVPIGEGEIVRFSWGRDDSPVHSEPDLVGERVFVSVLYGSEEEIRGMCEWREAKYGEVSLEG